MAEPTGQSLAAIQARQAALAMRHGAIAEADRALAEAVADAHATTVAAIHRLDAIQTAIDAAVQRQAEWAVDTPLGAREFQKFLVAKQREIITIVSEARASDAAKTAVLESLRSQYSSTG
jgi:Domain of unknown function (DUF4226)